MKEIREKGIRQMLLQALFMSMLCFLSACTDEKNQETVNVPEDWIQGLPESVSFKVSGGEQTFQFTLGEGVDASRIEYIMTEDAESWCKVSIGSDNIKIEATPFGYSRQADIKIIYDQEHQKSLKVMQITDFSDYFKDDVCSELKDGITEEEISTIPNEVIRELALNILKNNYNKEFRVAAYRPYQHPEVMAKINKTNKYSINDNPTGIWVEQGQEFYVMVGNIYEGGEIKLRILDLEGGFGNDIDIPIVKGLNKIVSPMKGLIYVLNNVEENIPLILDSDETKKAASNRTVNIHFINGKVNGYFDITKNDEEDWAPMLENAGFKFIDILGKYSHIMWEVEQFKIYNEKNGYQNITDIIKKYDDLVFQEQSFAGLVKYNRMFNNRLLFCNDQTAKSPNASDYRTVYPGTYNPNSDKPFYNSEMFLDPSKFKTRLWGPAHEAGHVNQLRPGVKWNGLTEVTNNINCLYMQELVGAECKLQNDKINCEDENGKKLGSKIIYDAAIELIVDGKRAHCLPNIKNIVRESQLVPFWQLKLYMVDVLGQKDFYKDLYEYFRNNQSPSEKGENGGMDQLDFVRQVCSLAKLDLTDFFDKWGFLKAVNTTLNDYGSKNFTITQKDIDALKEEIKSAGYPKPKHENIHLITNANLDEYKSKN